MRMSCIWRHALRKVDFLHACSFFFSKHLFNCISTKTRCTAIPSLMSELFSHSIVLVWTHHCHWSQSEWAFCQHCHGPHTHLHTPTHRWGHRNPFLSHGLLFCFSWQAYKRIHTHMRTLSVITSVHRSPSVSPSLSFHSYCFLSCFICWFVSLSVRFFLHIFVGFSSFFVSLTIIFFYFFHLDSFRRSPSPSFALSLCLIFLTVSNKMLYLYSCSVGC